MLNEMTALLVLACLASGMVGGVFFAFSTFVMKALSQVPHDQGMAAMQRINVVVLNPLFLGAFMGGAALSLACVVVSLVDWQAARSPLLLAGGFFHVIGTFVVTIAFNVPRNGALARLAPGSPEASAYWPRYLREWTMWNHVRTAAAIISAACTAVALSV